MLAASEASSQSRYIPTEKEELYGSWVNETKEPRKVVNFAGGWKDFAHVADSAASAEGTEEISSKWTDPEGNTWYRISGEVTAGRFRGVKFQTLVKISRNAMVREQVTVFGYNAFNRNSYPRTIDPGALSYCLLRRAVD